MAETYRFFDSSEGDIREYTASDFTNYFSRFLNDGVYTVDKAMGLKVENVSGFDIKVSPGIAYINGKEYINDADISFSLAPSDNVLDRIDRIVIELDTINKVIKAKVLKGDLGSQPITPELTYDSNIMQMPIAKIKVSNNSSQGVITDERVPVSSLVEIPFEDLRMDFDNWFEARQNSIGIEVYTGASQPENIIIGDLWIKRNANNGIDVLEYLGDNNFERLNKNIIVSPNDAVLDEMEDGDIWIKYE